MPRNLGKSFNVAIEGFLHALVTQRNLRIHLYVATFIIILGILYCSYLEILILIVTITLVFLAEMFNTAAELMVDLAADTFHPLAKRIKDVTAGAVLLTAINAAIIGYLIFSHHLSTPTEKGFNFIRVFPGYLAAITLSLSLLLGILTKVALRKGTPLRGGMPSLHSTIAFSIWTIILFSTQHVLLILLVFLLSSIVAYDRVKRGIHSYLEATIGAFFGVGITSFIFWFFRR